MTAKSRNGQWIDDFAVVLKFNRASVALLDVAATTLEYEPVLDADPDALALVQRAISWWKSPAFAVDYPVHPSIVIPRDVIDGQTTGGAR